MMSHEICDEMKKIREELTNRNIEWSDCSEIYKVNGGYDSFDGEEGNEGLLEIMIGNFEPIGWLKAENCLKLIDDILKGVTKNEN